MGEPIRIRARLKDGVTEVHVLMPHPMETGLRLDDGGQPVPAHHITDVRIAVAGRDVLKARMGSAISRDPLLTFRFAGARVGERISVAWTDNLGDQRSDEALIS
jgi:sulfur-oxidizing protein SoxZ